MFRVSKKAFVLCVLALSLSPVHAASTVPQTDLSTVQLDASSKPTLGGNTQLLTDSSGSGAPEKLLNEAEPYASTVRRGLPAPFEGTAFPFKEWPIIGSPVIGSVVSRPTNLLMTGISKTPLRAAFDKARLEISGWVDPGINFSTSKHSNAPYGFSLWPNQPDLNEIVVRVERKPDTAQKEHLDIGFHVDQLYGIDYIEYLTNGIAAHQATSANRYGYDIPQAYIDVYYPKVADGVNLRVGRFMTDPFAALYRNYMFSRTYNEYFAPYTAQGAILTTKLNDNWTVQTGITTVAESSLWTKRTKPSGWLGLQWISPNNKDSVYLLANNLNDASFYYHNWQNFYALWTHKFTQKFHTRTQLYYTYMKNVPANISQGFETVTYNPGPNKAFGWSLEAVNYLEYQLTKKDFISLRNEILFDPNGYFTGYRDIFTGHAPGVTHHFNKWLSFRPEIRWDQSYRHKTFDYGKIGHQFVFAADLLASF